MQRSNPYADYGTVVTGNRFIGRGGQLETIKSRVFGERAFGSMAIFGFPRIGKTSLVAEAIRRSGNRSEEQRVVVAQVNVGTFGALGDLWRSVIRDIGNEVCRRGLDANRSGVETEVEKACVAECFGFHEHVRPVFAKLRNAGVRAVCVLDEFDEARRLFSEAPEWFHCLGELGSNEGFKAGIILVAKRPVAEIARRAGVETAYWRRVFSPLRLGPFSTEEAELFFCTLKSNGLSLCARGRDLVLEHCCTHPYLLDSLGFRAWGYTEQGGRADAEWIKRTCEDLIAEYALYISELNYREEEVRELRDEVSGTKSKGDCAYLWRAIDAGVREKKGVPRPEQPVDLDTVIRNGESSGVEFKSTLRRNLKTGRTDDAVQLAVLKTLAAFLNTEGGMLIVGVADDREPVGNVIKNDGFRNDDQMKLHLVGLVNNRMGTTVMTRIRVNFQEYRGAVVMVARCEPSPRPVYVTENGGPQFYVRSGPSSNKVQVDQIHGYINDRWPDG